MNFTRSALLGSLLALSATSVFAVDTADLQVIGTIAPVACTPTFASGGVVDYGFIPTASLSPTESTQLAVKSISYAITCNAPIAIAMAWTDSRNGTSGSSSVYSFGLGKQDANNIGGYSVSAVSAIGDGAAVTLIESDSGGAFTAVVTGIMAHDYDRIVSFAPTGTVLPGAFQNYSGVFDVRATIAPTSTLDLSKSIALDGLATIEVRYL